MAETPVYIKPPATIQSKIISVVLGAGGALGLYVVTRMIYYKWQSNKEELKAADTDSAASYAQRIRMAFDNDGWWGTDTVRLRQLISEIPSRDFFKAVCDSYARLYSNDSLMRDMKGELQSTQYEEMIDMIAAKPVKEGGASPMNLKYVAWSRRLKAAFDKTYGPFPGTDEAAVKQVLLEIPSKYDYGMVEKVYLKLYGSTLESDYQSELQFWEKDYKKQIMGQKPQNP